MKCNTIIDINKEEEIIIHAKKRRPLIDEIERLALENSNITGYKDNIIKQLALYEIICFSIEDNKLHAYTNNDKYIIKNRLYQIEEIVDSNFIKINQSCIANINQIKKFDATLGASLLVIFKNGHSDYISRRELKNVKKRLGL